ncbi:unnamed protein product [Caenorhabditis auriculariae]|uniref:ATPase AAA-type core domain-containing protein n=1 Tax=Caenorhabditis auriculariae TaxID=2777116 RepID=A0A8S1HER5_9PELO|nr:unnamed protein product [Caenorhabditis auriculariae]
MTEVETSSNCSSTNSSRSTEEKQGKSQMPKIQLELRLNRKIAKSVAEGRLEEIGKMLRSTNKVLNWKSFLPFKASRDGDSEESELEIEDLFEEGMLGTTQMTDGAPLTEFLHDFSATSSNVHFYKLNDDGPLSQNLSGNDDSEEIVGSQLWQLPCVEFEHIYENLIYDSHLKNELMSYVYSLIHFSDRGDHQERGKTSLCKGLAQHLSIRLNNRYSHSVFVEIHSHSLFSKWFSESGKLIHRMFDQIDELAEDKKCMVFVLIDEVESLGMSREGSSSRSEPADAIRAVNALLTQIDRVRRRQNVLILCTSNLEKCLDGALVDRADMVRHVGVPSLFALYTMLRSCIEEMQRIGVVEELVEEFSPIDDVITRDLEDLPPITQELLKVARLARGLSGRAISMLPTLVFSRSTEEVLPMSTCLRLFQEAITEKTERLKNSKQH